MSAARDRLSELAKDFFASWQNPPPNSVHAVTEFIDYVRGVSSLRAPQSGPGLYGFLAAQGDLLAQHIRTVDGSNSLGAGALAERLVECGWRHSLNVGAGSGAETPPPSPDELLVTDFGVAMAERLRAASRRGRSGWQEMSPKQLLRRAEQELGELRAAVAANAPELDVVHEAADVGNFCAMLATVYDRGAEPPPQPEISQT